MATGALVMALGGVTYASIPGPDGTIHSCLDSRGTMRVIDSDASCGQGETALNFSQKGPQGAPGAQGAQGPAGAAGETKLLNFTRSAPIAVPRKAGTPVGSFDLPEGKWAVTFTGGVRIPGSEAVSLNVTRGQKKLHSAAQVDFRNTRAFSWGANVSCKMSLGDGSVRTAVGNGNSTGLLLPAVQAQHSGGGGGGAGKPGTERAAIYMNLVVDVPAGGERGFLACNQPKSTNGFSTPAAQLHDISIHAVQVQDIGALNFTPAR